MSDASEVPPVAQMSLPHLSTGGVVIASPAYGDGEAATLASALERLGLSIVERLTVEEANALVMQRP